MKIDKNPSAEDIARGMMRMKVGDYITGKEVSKIDDKLSKASMAIDKITRVDVGLKVNFTWLGRIALKAAKNFSFENGSVVAIKNVNWPGANYSVLQLSNPKGTIGFDGREIPMNVYLHNNGYTNQYTTYPKYIPIFKGKWQSK